MKALRVAGPLKTAALPERPATEMGLGGVASRMAVLPDEKFLAAISLLMLAGDKPEVQALMAEARDRLRELRPPRPLNLKRQFCMPFEDILTSAAEPRAGRIPRAFIDSAWAMLMERDPATLARLHAELAQVSATEPARVVEISARLWAVAAERLAAPWPGIAPRMPLMLAALRSAPEIETFKQKVPGWGLTEFDRETVALILRSARRLAERKIPLDAYFLVVASRLTCAARLIALLEAAQIPLPGMIAGEIDQLSVEMLSQQADWFSENAASLSPDAIALAADRLMRDTAEIRTLVRGKSRRALEDCAATLAPNLRQTVKTQVLDRAIVVIDAALGDEPGKAAILAAEGHIRALRRARRPAGQLGLSQDVERTLTAIDQDLRREIEAGFKRRSAADADGADPVFAEERLFRTIRLLELLAGSREIEPIMTRLRRKPAEA